MAHILIVGANQGIGYYIVKRLLALGHFVSVLDINITHLKSLQTEYPKRLFPTLPQKEQSNRSPSASRLRMQRMEFHSISSTHR